MKRRRLIAWLLAAALLSCGGLGALVGFTESGRILLRDVSYRYQGSRGPGVTAFEARGCTSVFSADMSRIADEPELAKDRTVTCAATSALTLGCVELATLWLAETHEQADGLQVWVFEPRHSGVRCAVRSQDGGWEDRTAAVRALQ